MILGRNNLLPLVKNTYYNYTICNAPITVWILNILTMHLSPTLKDTHKKERKEKTERERERKEESKTFHPIIKMKKKQKAESQ